MSNNWNAFLKKVQTTFLVPSVPKRPLYKKRRSREPLEPFQIIKSPLGDYGFLGSKDNRSCVVSVSQLGRGFEMMTGFAKELNDSGVNCFAIDYNGYRRESEGGKLDFNKSLSEVQDLVSKTRESHDKVFVVGSCYGGDLAYQAMMESDIPIEGIFLQSPKFPYMKDALRKYLPRCRMIQHPVYSKIAIILRNSDKIPISVAIGRRVNGGSLQNELVFNQSDIRDYFNREPKQVRPNIPLCLIAGECDRVIPYEHTEMIVRKLEDIHTTVAFQKVYADHDIFLKDPRMVVDVMRERYDLI